MKKNKHYIYRPIKTSDANSLYELSKKARGGLSNLPKTLNGAKKIIKLSNDSFENKVNLKNKRFTFVVESNEKEVIGISAIKTRVGIKRPYYSFLVNSAVKYPTFASSILTVFFAFLIRCSNAFDTSSTCCLENPTNR